MLANRFSTMEIKRSHVIPDVMVLSPKIFYDDRGRFLETYRVKEFIEESGQHVEFVQGNLSYSIPNVLRGLHYQINKPQGKLMRCISGSIQHVCVDLREASPYFGKYVSTLLDDINCREVWAPPGFACGFLVYGSMGATVQYDCSSYYVDEWSRALNYDDPDVGVLWMTKGRRPIISNKDRAAAFLRDTEAVKV